MITYEIVYQKLNDDLRNQIKSLWVRNSILTSQEQDARVNQVVAIAKNESNEIVGVSSVYKDTFDNNLYYFYRMFVDVQSRNRIISRNGNSLSRVTRAFLKEYNEVPKPKGIIAAVENTKISHKLMEEMDWNFYGVLFNKPIWYVNFDGTLMDSIDV